MPTPPKESIGGSKLGQQLSFAFAKVAYDYLIEMEEFKESEDFQDYTEDEKLDFKAELIEASTYYENLTNRVKNY